MHQGRVGQNSSMKARLKPRLLIALFAALAFAPSGRAVVTNIVWYRLGENDPGAANGVAVTNTTTDVMGFENLKQFGSPVYTNAVSAGASNNVGSSLAVQFNGTNQYLSNAVVSTLVDNFGLEVWVNPAATANSYIIAYNGNTASNGWGIYLNNGAYFGLFGGVSLVGLGTATAGTWSHLALVRANGVATFYVNGIASGSTTASAPLAPSGGFAIGAPPQSVATEKFGGTIDELRVFTLGVAGNPPTPQFSTNDLLFNQQRISTLPATGTTAASATLNGGEASTALPTAAWFEWGATTNYGNVTSAQLFGGSVTSTNFSQGITGLVPGITYNFHAVASNSASIVFGANQSFTTPVFTLVASNLPGVFYSAVAWGDYDNDGRLDILITGQTNPYAANSGYASGIAQVWRNTGNGFSNINAGLPGVSGGAVAWGDYDNDGLLDILLTGVDTNGQFTTQIWRNTGNGFSNINVGLPGGYSGSVAWGDYDNDGRLDILLSGDQGATNIGSNIFAQIFTQVWRNTGNGFVNINAGLPGVAYD